VCVCVCVCWCDDVMTKVGMAANQSIKETDQLAVAINSSSGLSKQYKKKKK